MRQPLGRHLYETLVAIAETGSLTSAATRLNITQSAVSHRLAEAERRVGQPLIERRTLRGLQPTPAGLALVQAAQRALPELERAEVDISRAADRPTRIVRIGVSSYDCYHWLADFNERLRDVAGDVLLELVAVGDTPSSRLNDGSADILIAPGIPTGTYAHQALFSDELVLLSAPGLIDTSSDWVPSSAVQGEVFFTYSRVPAPGFEAERFLTSPKVSPKTIVVVEHTAAIAEMVAAGLGIAILSRWAMKPWLDTHRLVAHRCGPDGLDLPWSALTRSGTPHDAIEATVVSELADFLDQRAPGSALDSQHDDGV